jgi:hypothetical protein
MTRPVAPSWLALLLAGLSALASVYSYLSHNDRDHETRISKLEAHQDDTTQRLDRIETKIDALVKWAFGQRLAP